MKIQYSLFDTLLEPVFVLNAEQKVIYCNETAAIMCEISIRKITKGMKFSELFHFSEPIEALKRLIHISDPTPYKEVNFKTSVGSEGKVQITLQPIFDSMGDKNWIVFMRDVTLEERLQKKYRAELEQKEDVIKDLEDAKLQLENYSKNLEKMVADRTAELSRLNQMMSALLDSLGQGFFVFNAEGLILEVSSKACENTIECRPQGKNIWDILKLPENKVPGFKKWMQTLFMEMLPFEDLSPLGPPTYPHSQNKNISLEYFPLRSSEGTMDGVVVVASDITSLVEAKHQAERDREYAKLIINLVQNKKEIGRFIREAQSLLADLKLGLSVSFAKADGEFLFRQLHTLKGGAALFSIQEMAEHCHAAESLLTKFNENPSAQNFEALKAEGALIPKAFDQFLKKSEEILGSASLNQERHIEVPYSKFKSVLQRIEKFPQGTAASEVLLTELIMEPIGSYFAPYNDVALKVAEKQEKELKPIEFQNADLKILPEIYAGLFATFVHSFRNSVDHGIETPAERTKKGKPAAGHIRVNFEVIKDASPALLRISVIDDGAGVNPQKIREILAKKNISNTKMNDFEVIQHIFDSQLSTRDQVSETSGRGVGMDAIKHAAEELKGRVWVESQYGKGTSLFVEVPFITSLEPQETRKLKAA